MVVNDFYVSLRKTKIVNIDKDAHKLPPDWGPFKEFKVADYYCPNEWSNDGIFVSVKEGEPLWIDFQLNNACAVIPSVQQLNPITGESADLENGLKKDPKQNYLVLPDQKWLDGYAREGKVYQFVVTKHGESLAVNEFVLPVHMQDSHALGFAFFEPKQPPRPIREDRYPNNYNEISTNPMWFSPTHTPQNWVNATRKRGIYQSITKSVTVPEFTLPGGVGLNDSETCTAGGSGAGASGGIVCDFAEASEGPQAGPGAAGQAVGQSDELQGYSEENMTVIDQRHFASDVVDILESNTDAEVDDTDLDKASMGMGGRIEQNITTDNNTVEYYKEKHSAVLTIYMALPEQFEAIIKRGKRQDASREDRHLHSGDIGGVPVPLIKAEA